MSRTEHAVRCRSFTPASSRSALQTIGAHRGSVVFGGSIRSPLLGNRLCNHPSTGYMASLKLLEKFRTYETI
jgi:hypothetical protein